ncbi:MAG TPA: MBL fold metallo-hydrolase [Steroidobacteraceae bacterium]
MRAIIFLTLIIATSLLARPAQSKPPATQAACQSLIPASQGGPMPSGDVAILRWLGTSNYELAYHGKIILMDAFYNRPARTASLGFAVDQVRKADVILIGHAHFDHISDVAAVASQTGAPVVGSAITTAEAIELGVPKAQTVTVAGNETLRYGDIKIRPTHIVHSTIENGLLPALDALYKLDAPPLTPEQQAQAAAVQARGSRDPRVVPEGTMGFTFTFPNGFTIVWFDSVGDPNTDERQLASELAPVDVAIFPWTPHPISETQLAYTFQHLQLFRPRLYLPDHHDSIWGAWLDNGLAPLFMKIRDELPGTKFAEPLYRSAICIATAGSARGTYLH